MNLKELLAERNITCAHVVDDAYDSSPTSPLTPEEIQAVLNNIDDDALNSICTVLGLQPDDEDGVRESLYGIDSTLELYRRRTELAPAAASALFDQFMFFTEGKLTQLKPLLELLSNAGIKCETFGSDYDPKGSTAPHLVFVDLKLKEGIAGLPKHEDAVEVCTKLKAEHPKSRPFVFLMSSLPLALGQKREEFRKGAELFQSEFDDIDKATFSNADELERILASYTKSLGQLAALRKSMEDVASAVSQAGMNVMAELKALDLADYFVLYHNTASVEKTQLGTYIVELLLEYLAHEVEGQSQVWDLAKVLDNLNIETLPRARFGITPAAAKLYSANMLHSEAMLLAEDDNKNGPAHGHFFTGDIFFEALSLNLPTPARAFTIITPVCDLVRPDRLKGKSILLCEGEVKDFETGSNLIASDELPIVVMKSPRSQEKLITIEWKKKKLHIWDDEDRANFANPQKCVYVRKGRLRPVFALQLQRSVTSDLSRVGTQKPPNALVPHRIKCFVSDGQKWRKIYEDDKADAAALSRWDDEKHKKWLMFIISDPTLHKVMAALSTWLKEHQTVPGKATLNMVLGEDVPEVIRGYKQKVPEKAPPDVELDVTAYPFAKKWNGQGKAVALVPERSASPYSNIADGQNVGKDKPALIVFIFETTVEDESSTEDTETASDQVHGVAATAVDAAPVGNQQPATVAEVANAGAAEVAAT